MPPLKKLLVQRLSSAAKLPTRAYKHDAGFDLYSGQNRLLAPKARTLVKTGLKIAIPAGYAGLIWDKSGLAQDGLHILAGVIDAGFRGEITVNLINLSAKPHRITAGQKIAQLIIQKVETPKIEETEINDITERGNSGYGSSGKF